MYIVGHCLSVIDSGTCSADDMDGFGGLATMLPDILDNHGWSYVNCFDWPGRSGSTRFILAHMLGDWFVHFGGNIKKAERKGWAYENMGHYESLFATFFQTAYERRLKDDPEPADTPRGFAHTFTEYSIDLWMADNGMFDPFFHSVQKGLSGIGRTSDAGVGSKEWLYKVAESERIPAKQVDRAKSQIASFSERAEASRDPGEFVVLSIINKFGLKNSQPSIDYVRECLNEGIKVLGEEAIVRHYRECCDFIAQNMPKDLQPSSPIRH